MSVISASDKILSPSPTSLVGSARGQTIANDTIRITVENQLFMSQLAKDRDRHRET